MRPVYFWRTISQTALILEASIQRQKKGTLMTRQLSNSRHVSARITLIAFVIALGASCTSQTGQAADLAEQAHSLRKVPADATFYSASLRLRDQWHVFKDSKAYAKLMEIPLIQFAKMQVTFQWQESEQPTLAKVREYVQSSTDQDGAAVLKEMFSDEIFSYGGSDIVESLKLFMDFNSLQRSVQVEAHGDKEKMTEVSVNRALEILDKHKDTFKLPTMVFGFRIKDQARAKRELDEIHSLLRNFLDEKQPDLAARLQREQIGGHEFLTFSVDSSMLPWEKIREEAKMLDDEQFEKLKAFIAKHKVTLALGVTDEFVLFSFGESTEHLQKLGTGSVLAEQASIKRLQQHAGQRVVSIQYLSKVLTENLQSPKRTMDDLAAMADQALSGAKISEEHRKALVTDLRGLNLATYMPEPSDKSGVVFMTGRGYEAFNYSEGKRSMFDSSKPLTILSHVGGDPMLVVASRSKENVKDYENAVVSIKKLASDIEQVVEEKVEAEKWAKYQDLRKRVTPLLDRLDKATRDYLYPALAEGQCAFVMDVAAKSKQWFKKMPESPKPLPMFELGFEAGVSDAEKLRQAVREYVDVARDAYKLVKENNPKQMPEWKLPKANVSELTGGGKLYSYPLPKKAGVDPQVAINAGLTDKFAAVSTMPKTTERLLHETTADFDTSIKLDRPAAMVVHFQFAKLIDSLRPWVDYGGDVATGKLKPPKEKGEKDSDEDQVQANPAMMQLGFVVPQVHQFLDFASAMRGVTSISYEENGVWV